MCIRDSIYSYSCITYLKASRILVCLDICQSLEFWKMQISYNATRVKIWNLFLFSKNFIAKNFEVKKIRRKKKFEVKKKSLLRDPGRNVQRAYFWELGPWFFHFKDSSGARSPPWKISWNSEISIPHPLTVNITVHFWRLTVKNNRLWRLTVKS